MTLNVSAVLLAGGAGTRMKQKLPKQFIKLQEKEIALYSFEALITHPQVKEVIVVCHKSYHELFQKIKTPKRVVFAPPGIERQDSSFNGYQKVSSDIDLICVHDAARPFIHHKLLTQLFSFANNFGAAVLGLKSTSTLKLVNSEGFVDKTLDREMIFEAQTPQVGQVSLFKKAFDYVKENNICVTDEMSMLEVIGAQIKIVDGEKNNLKITTVEDLKFCEYLLKDLGYGKV